MYLLSWLVSHLFIIYNLFLTIIYTPLFCEHNSYVWDGYLLDTNKALDDPV